MFLKGFLVCLYGNEECDALWKPHTYVDVHSEILYVDSSKCERVGFNHVWYEAPRTVQTQAEKKRKNALNDIMIER